MSKDKKKKQKVVKFELTVKEGIFVFDALAVVRDLLEKINPNSKQYTAIQNKIEKVLDKVGADKEL